MWDTLEQLRHLADRWDFCAAASAAGLLAAVGPWRARTGALALPACGFLLRKLLLFVPLCGAVTTTDRVVFWSGTAFVYYLVMLLAVGGSALGVAHWLARPGAAPAYHRHANGDDVSAGITAGYLLVGLGALLSLCLMPLDGVAHLYVPGLSALGLPKLLLVSPALLWACWGGLAVQLAVLPAGPVVRQTATTAFAAVVLTGGAVSLLGQPFGLWGLRGPDPVVRAVRAAPVRAAPEFEGLALALREEPPPDSFWFRPRKPSKAMEQIQQWWERNVSRPEPEAECFLAQWARLVPEIDRTGVNLVEKEPVEQTAALRARPAVPPGALGGAALGALVLLALCAGAERGARTDPEPDWDGGAGHTPPRPPAGSEPPAADGLAALRAKFGREGALAVPFWLALLALPVALLLLASLGSRHGSSGATTAGVLIGIVGVPAVLVLLTGCWLSQRAAVLLPEQQRALAAFLVGDRQGRAGVSPLVLKLLASLQADPKLAGRLLAGQPVSVLVDCLLGPDPKTRQEALRRLPADIAAADVERLTAAEFPESRVAAIRQTGCPRGTRLRLTGDPMVAVRAAALGSLAPLSPPEVRQLLGSVHADVRAFVAGSTAATRRQLIRLAVGDDDSAVRRAARGRFPAPTAEELWAFVRSPWPDVRAFALTRPTIDHGHLMYLAVADGEFRHRSGARDRLGHLGADDLRSLVASPHADSRGYAVAQRGLPRDVLLRLAAHDPDAGVRERAQLCLRDPSAAELGPFATAPHPDARRYALGFPALPRRLLAALCADPVEEVARSAFARYGPAATATDLRALAISPAIWEELARHPHAPPERVARLLAEHVPKSRYVIDVPAEDGDPADGATRRAEQGHYEYGPPDVELANAVIDAAPGRRAAVLGVLAAVDGALHARLC